MTPTSNVGLWHYYILPYYLSFLGIITQKTSAMLLPIDSCLQKMVLCHATLPSIFEYKYIWRSRNTSFSKIGGRYDRARCSDNCNHKKVIIRGYRYEFSWLVQWTPVSDCIPASALPDVRLKPD